MYCADTPPDLRPGVNCNGCGARITERQQASHTSRIMGVDGLDKLWHEKYRPMAALCTMVEEAKGEA